MAKRLRNTKAVIKLTSQTLQNLLDLPEGIVVHHLYVHPPSDSIAVVVYGEDLPEQPWDCELPMLEGSWNTKAVSVPIDGSDPDDPEAPRETYYRWSWLQT